MSKNVLFSSSTVKANTMVGEKEKQLGVGMGRRDERGGEGNNLLTIPQGLCTSSEL